MTSSQKTQTTLDKGFKDLEKEALKEISLEIIKSDLQKSLSQLHQKNMEEVGKKISIIKEDCAKKVQEGIKQHLKEQLEERFQNVVQSCQTDISNLISSLLKHAEQDLNSLNTKVSQTNALCDEIQKKYSFRWDKPFLITTFSCILTGAFVCIILILLQFSPLAVFLMNKQTREIYNSGLYWEEIKRQMVTHEPEISSKTQKEAQKRSKLQKKKKPS